MKTDDMKYVRDLDALIAASELLALCGQYSIDNPTVAIKDNPYAKPLDDMTRRAMGSKNVLWICKGCGYVGHKLYKSENGPLTTCCHARIYFDMPKPRTR